MIESKTPSTSEQLWLTGSDKGLGSSGFQLHAASPGLMKGNASVKIQSARIKALLKYIHYTLPQGSEASRVDSAEAPVSLAFLKAGQEAILTKKTFVSSDTGGHAGSFFAHMLTDLPSTRSGDSVIPFSARTAIELWNSPNWQTGTHIDTSTRDLQPVVFASLAKSSLSQHSENDSSPTTIFHNGDLKRIDLTEAPREYLEFLIQAFLQRQPGQHIYIAAKPSIVASLIWGLTHCLPVTLKALQDLTFSTYERVEDERPLPIFGRQQDLRSLPTIIGTCWLTQPRELPIAYYQDGALNGFALNSYNGRKTSFTPSAFIADFASFATDCLLDENDHSYPELTRLLAQAEAEQCTDLAHFERIYSAYQEQLSQPQIEALFHAVQKNLDEIADNRITLLADINRLGAPNVLHSIVYWIAMDRDWWDETCRQETRLLLTAIARYESQPLPAEIIEVLNTLYDAILNLAESIALQINAALQDDQEFNMYFWTEVLEDIIPSDQELHPWLVIFQNIQPEDLYQPVYQTWWQFKGCALVDSAWQQFAEEQAAYASDDADAPDPITPLTPFSNVIADQIHLAVQQQDDEALTIWCETFIRLSPPAQDPQPWLYLLQTFIQGSYSTFYWKWWNIQGKAALAELEDFSQSPPFVTTFAALANDIVGKIAIIIEQADPLAGMRAGSDWQAWLLWDEILLALQPYVNLTAEASSTWLSLWQHIWSYPFPVSYVQWWQRRGNKVARTLRIFAEHNSRSEIATLLLSFIFEQVLPVTYQQIDVLLEQDTTTAEIKDELFALLQTVIDVVPQQYQVDIWTDMGSEISKDLIGYLSRTLESATFVDDVYSWEKHKLLLEAWAQIPALSENRHLTQWLTVSWESLMHVISAPYLPVSWQEQALMNVIHSPITLQPEQMISMVAEKKELFETVLQCYIQDEKTAPTAIEFFTYLVTHHYSYTARLLACFLIAEHIQADQISTLFQIAHITPAEAADLLEQDSAAIIANHMLPPELIDYIEHYLIDLDIDDLSKSAASTLLAHLHQRLLKEPDAFSERAASYITGWYSLRTLFITNNTVLLDWLKSNRTTVGQMPYLAPKKRHALRTKLLTLLVATLRYETEIIYALSSGLSHLYMDEDEEFLDAEQQMLKHMIYEACTMYADEHPSLHLLSYIKLALIQAQPLSMSQKELYIDDCLYKLTEHLNPDILEQLDTHIQFWQPELQQDWQAFRLRQPDMREHVLTRHLKDMLHSGNVEEIEQAYQQFLQVLQSSPLTHINQEESEQAQLVRDLVTAYRRQDSVALLAAHHNIQSSSFSSSIRYTPAIQHAITQLLTQPPVPPQQGRNQPTPIPVQHPSSQRHSMHLAQKTSSSGARSAPDLHAYNDTHRTSSMSYYQQSGSTSSPIMPAQADFTQIETIEQPDQVATAPIIIGEVVGSPITLVSLNRMYALLDLYIDYRLNVLEASMRLNKFTRDAKAYYEQEQKALQSIKRLTDAELRLQALSLLIDNILIVSDIKQRIARDPYAYDLFALEESIYHEFRVYQLARYSEILRQNRLTEKDVLQALKILRRRERFADQLLREKDNLEDWLEKTKQDWQEEIRINYARASITRANDQTYKSKSGFFGRFKK